ncbi:hypothetical protein A2Z00_05015 [Candidatus Gottesmanbacteria bacterium RBG_13_45_10]|uniref:Methyltransferase type 11 domain-containing protein n=1 Tax=Candidatus Gottesmanbacteria bacterium RBG_13_45_10 TaxID=1798370 RepID=A0A1F5ZGE3_9BACT|nr:MAG: hypothetical protein A2Z00_05015 [Candidatus Gottesmanbacteria bacterium RBG_13_45_10]
MGGAKENIERTVGSVGQATGLERPGVTIARIPTTAETPWFESPFPKKGAGDGRLGFDQPYMAENLAFSRNKLIKGGETTVGAEIAANLQDLLKLQPGQVVVDLGMGPGLVAQKLSGYLGAGWLYCVDASTPMLKYAHRMLVGRRATLIHGDIHTVDKLIPEKADAAVLSGNVHLLTDRLVAFEAIWRILKPQGKLVIVTHAYFNPRKDTNRFAATVDELSKTRPDLKVEGLRLPIISQKELRDIVEQLQRAGFTVKQREKETDAPDVPDVYGQGQVPARVVATRLRLMTPGIEETIAQGIAQDVIGDTYRGRQMQVYLLCTKRDPFLLPIQK